MPFRGELDARPIMQAIWQARKTCYLPILTDEDKLYFSLYHEKDDLILNRYLIFEPKHHDEKIAVENLDIVVTPLLAFDLQGHRLGTGGGYYDRTFAFLKNKKSRKPIMLGLAYALQQADMLPCDTWDISLDGVITEEGCFLF